MQDNNWNQPYNQNSYPPYNTPEPERKGFAIASLVLGILSLVLCCLFGGVLGIVGLILGIVSLVKKESKMGMAIAGIITSAFGIIFGIAMAIYFVMFFGFITENYDAIVNSEITVEEAIEESLGESKPGADTEGSAAEADDEDPFASKSFEAGDGSVIYFEADGSFVWYQDDADHEDYYYVGTYDCYRAEFAESYIVTYLGEYGVTEEELADYYDRNADSEFYTEDNFTCLVLHNESAICDGEEKITEPYDTNYMGFYMDGYYDAANMGSGEYAAFTER